MIKMITNKTLAWSIEMNLNAKLFRQVSSLFILISEYSIQKKIAFLANHYERIMGSSATAAEPVASCHF